MIFTQQIQIIDLTLLFIFSLASFRHFRPGMLVSGQIFFIKLVNFHENVALFQVISDVLISIVGAN